ncbi:efflux RND transporter periplasmic adaptor subunit [Rhizobium halophytocola]|uniref:HlyD family efflux transporter periplasmic adaptor subunit n=1 Tax=Rhizobium halophytocola TaxID=735519 RepID=A0ABS4E657_9HYPH|nr:HlyD family efflux transporter periplasmic adaptor subunit [Rhizobium halophytocola]MBP1853401.1 hypothetical protein [Rhizobium halophytocola]
MSALTRLAPGGSTPDIVFGTLPPGLDLLALAEGLSDKPLLKRAGEHLFVLVPRGKAGWIGWLFDTVPPVTELPGLLEILSGLSAAFDKGAAAASMPPTATAAGQERIARVLADMAGLGPLKKKSQLQVLANSIFKQELARAAVFVECRARGGSFITASDRKLAASADEFVRVSQLERADEDRIIHLRAQSMDDDRLESALLAESLGAAGIVLALPANGIHGMALFLIDPAPNIANEIGMLSHLASIATQCRAHKDDKNNTLWKGAALAAVVAAAVVLALPADLIVTASALSAPQQSVVAALPFDSFLQSMTADVGDTVTADTDLATLSAPDIEAKRSQAQLQMSVQQITATAALAKNDYGNYKLATQRIETYKGQVDRYDQQLEQLHLKSPVAGTVIRTIGRDGLGRFVPAGQEIAVIQSNDEFAVTLTFSRVDATLIRPGQPGEVYFRGLNGRPYAFVVETPIFEERASRDSDETHLVARARIVKAGKGELIGGLSGFGRVEAGRAPRIYVLSRHALEYLRIKAWIYLGLHF